MAELVQELSTAFSCGKFYQTRSSHLKFIICPSEQCGKAIMMSVFQVI